MQEFARLISHLVSKTIPFINLLHTPGAKILVSGFQICSGQEFFRSNCSKGMIKSVSISSLITKSEIQKNGEKNPRTSHK